MNRACSTPLRCTWTHHGRCSFRIADIRSVEPTPNPAQAKANDVLTDHEPRRGGDPYSGGLYAPEENQVGLTVGARRRRAQQGNARHLHSRYVIESQAIRSRLSVLAHRLLYQLELNKPHAHAHQSASQRHRSNLPSRICNLKWYYSSWRFALRLADGRSTWLCQRCDAHRLFLFLRLVERRIEDNA